MKCDLYRPPLAAPWSVALFVAATATAVAARPAQAQTDDPAAARVLFEEGRELAKDGKYAAACPIFERARQLYTSAGILINLGDCYEKIGRTASAWLTFGEAEVVATRTNRSDHSLEAQHRHLALEPNLRRLVIVVPREVPGLLVKRDGAVVASAAWGVAVPVDPGIHEIRAEAPARETWIASVSAPDPGQRSTVVIPELSPATIVRGGPASASSAPAAEAAPRARPESDRASPSGQVRAAGAGAAWGLLLGGAAVGATGAVLLVFESDRSQRANQNKDPADWDRAATLWWVGLATAIGGGAAAAGGVAWLLGGAPRTPNAPTTGVGLLPLLGASGHGLKLEAEWHY